ncbi:hypothetical protein HDU76_000693 [Blyttiomyces sp. JEL0837]|nr:hypothetical protein HDU76_000693 [Blyttiomyces sp. JEL0837]
MPSSKDSAKNGSSTNSIAMPKSLVIGTRKSELAMIQTNHVLSLLQKAHPNITFTIEGMTTTGDEVLNVALAKIGSKSLFTKELEVALDEKRVDLVVHSLKDLPTSLPEGMAVGAILEREDPRDAVVMSARMKKGTKIADLPKGSVVGTSSVRRSAQLKRKFPHLVFQDVRGNLNTRLKKLDAEDSPYSCLLLAYAGLVRMGWHHRISEILTNDVILHAVGQGAIAVECREDDEAVKKVIHTLEHADTAVRCHSERAFMRQLEGGCSVPLGVWTEIVSVDGKRVLKLQGSVCSLDGKDYLHAEVEAEVKAASEEVANREIAVALGERLGAVMLEKGARSILDSARAAGAGTGQSNPNAAPKKRSQDFDGHTPASVVANAEHASKKGKADTSENGV